MWMHAMYGSNDASGAEIRVLQLANKAKDTNIERGEHEAVAKVAFPNTVSIHDHYHERTSNTTLTLRSPT